MVMSPTMVVAAAARTSVDVPVADGNAVVKPTFALAADGNAVVESAATLEATAVAMQTTTVAMQTTAIGMQASAAAAVETTTAAIETTAATIEAAASVKAAAATASAASGTCRAGQNHRATKHGSARGEFPHKVHECHNSTRRVCQPRPRGGGRDWTANADPAIRAASEGRFGKLSGSIEKLPKKALINQVLRWGMV
jgi:hypothetical protein